MNFKTKISKWAAAAAAALPLAAQAGTAPVQTVPEPSTWALIGLAGAIGALIARNRRK